MSDEEVAKFFEGLGWSPRFLENDEIHNYSLSRKTAKIYDQLLLTLKLFKGRP